jgi:radical SAM superfamily enzyme YgiQ (UPF0313 family)
MIDVLFIACPTHEKDVIPWPLHPKTLELLARKGGKSAATLDLPYEIEHGNLPFPDGLLEASLELLKKHPASACFFSVYLSRSSSFPWIYALAKGLKKLFPDTVIVLGGAQFAAMGQRALEMCPFIDILCEDEIEPVLLPILELVKTKTRKFSGVGKLCYRDSSGKIITDTATSQKTFNLASLPVLKLPSNYYKPNAIVSVEAGRGCPQSCSFCSCRWVKKPRFKPANRLLDEIEHILTRSGNQDDRILMIEQDNLIYDPDFMKAFTREKRRRHLFFKYACFGRLDDLTPEMIDLLAESSCKVIYIGLESGSEMVLRSVAKRIDMGNAIPRIRALVGNGILTNTNFMYGYPEETLSDLHETLLLMAKVRWEGARISVSVLRPDPGSQVDFSIGRDDSLFLLDEPYFSELKAAGIEPATLPRPYAIRFWGIRNRHYDLADLAPKIEAFVYLLEFFPLSLYILLQGEKMNGLEMLESMPACNKGSTIPALNADNVEDYFQKLIVKLNGRLSSLYNELIRFEYLKYLWQEGKFTGKAPLFKHDVKRLYPIFTKNPKRLMNQTQVDFDA